MASHNELGIEGEKIAEKHLVSQGYEMVFRNYRFKHDEIDLIVTKNKVMVFVEVKTRANTYMGEPEEAVTKSKQKRIIKVANQYMIENAIDLEVRFDIIAIILNQERTTVNHIKDAFQPIW